MRPQPHMRGLPLYTSTSHPSQCMHVSLQPWLVVESMCMHPTHSQAPCHRLGSVGSDPMHCSHPWWHDAPSRRSPCTHPPHSQMAGVLAQGSARPHRLHRSVWRRAVASTARRRVPCCRSAGVRACARNAAAAAAAAAVAAARFFQQRQRQQQRVGAGRLVTTARRPHRPPRVCVRHRRRARAGTAGQSVVPLRHPCYATLIRTPYKCPDIICLLSKALEPLRVP